MVCVCVRVRVGIRLSVRSTVTFTASLKAAAAAAACDIAARFHFSTAADAGQTPSFLQAPLAELLNDQFHWAGVASRRLRRP